MSSIEEKRQKISAAELRIARLKFEISRQSRADNTRRKLLIGSFMMDAAKDDLVLLSGLRINGKALNDFLSRPADRLLFGLSLSIN